jgi:hypothetical protein
LCIVGVNFATFDLHHQSHQSSLNRLTRLIILIVFPRLIVEKRPTRGGFWSILA